MSVLEMKQGRGQEELVHKEIQRYSLSAGTNVATSCSQEKSASNPYNFHKNTCQKTFMTHCS